MKEHLNTESPRQYAVNSGPSGETERGQVAVSGY